MFLSFLSRFTSKKSQTPSVLPQIPFFQNIAIHEGGKSFDAFDLFHNDTSLSIDVLIFLPHYGLYVGEKLDWKYKDLRGASISKASLETKKGDNATHLGEKEERLRQKLKDVLSFDSTAIERFFWLPFLSIKEFNALDESFHQLLPKSRLIFGDDSEEEIHEKFKTMGTYREEPYTLTKIVGSLNAHTLLLPTAEMPFGQLLTQEQERFITETSLQGAHLLLGDYATGKSSVLNRKVIDIALRYPNEKILVLAPTLLAAERLRNELIAVGEYGSLTLNLDRFGFYPPQENLENFKVFQDFTVLVCDDAHLMSSGFVEMLKSKRGKRPLFLSSVTPIEGVDTVHELSSVYRHPHHGADVLVNEENLIVKVLLALRDILKETSRSNVMLINERSTLPQSLLKDAIDEYFGSDARILSSNFSLQYHNLDELLIGSSVTIAGLSTTHALIIGTPSPLSLSRASGTTTNIIIE